MTSWHAFQQQGYQHIELVDIYPVCLCIPALNSFQSVSHGTVSVESESTLHVSIW